MKDSQIDDRIRLALTDEDAELYEQFSVEPSLLQLALDAMKGRNRWLTVLVMIISTVFMVLGVISLVQLMNAESTRSLIHWALGFVFSMGAVSMMKIWYWMEMQRISVTREIKRLELQVACLAKRLTSDNPPS